METLEQRIRRVVREEVAVAPHDPEWPESFRREKEHLLSCLPNDLVRRVEHFGSTAVPGLAAKPIVDMLVEVTDLGATRVRIVPMYHAVTHDGVRCSGFTRGDPASATSAQRRPRHDGASRHRHSSASHSP
jgi:GrpB-like predicted nucleotidyltransferase (UPF0157 family)